MIYFFFHKTLDVGGPGVCIVEKLIAHHLPKKKDHTYHQHHCGKIIPQNPENFPTIPFHDVRF